MKSLNETKDLWIERLEDREEYVIPTAVNDITNWCCDWCCFRISMME